MRKKAKRGPALSRIAGAIPDFYVLEIDRIANDLLREGKDVIKLNLGKSELPMPARAVEEVAEKIYDKARREIVDPQGLSILREEIARDYRRAAGVSVSPSQVFVNNGTSPFFLSLFLLLLDRGDEVLLPLPYYPPYVANATIARAKTSFYPITNDGRLDLGVFRRKFRPGVTKLVVLNSPGNPLGNVLTPAELKAVLKIVGGRAYIVSDEIYDGFVYGTPTPSILSFAKPGRDKVVVLNGFSKIHHMYTRRLGYAVVPDDLAPALLKFQQHTVVCVDPVTQFAGYASLKNKHRLIRNDIKKEVAEYRRRLAASRKILGGTKLSVIPPAGSFYMCVDVGRYLSRRAPTALALATDLLEKAGVAVTPGDDFGRPDLFRVSLTAKNVLEGVRRMRAFFSGAGRGA